MSAARTAARRRRQYALGQKGLAQVFGQRAAPKYPGRVDAATSARRETAFRMRQKAIAGRKKK